MNLTNLIDLGFTLLIIFMIATPLINQEQTIPVNLPVESKSSQIKPGKDTRFVAITLKADGSYHIDNTRVSFADLELRLRALGATPKTTVIRIRADGNVPYQKIITLLDELKKNNLSKITFDTQAGS
ncbi:MAG: biopolymer transporter ExbD [Opitutaceae bacterium]|jgi:biopolymer transport protein ExbD|nr:biopolymer transporter ExbD [Opitutaceae bacterium]